MSEPTPRRGRPGEVAELLRHDDPSQLLFQLAEIFGDRTYLRHGVEVGEGDVVLDVGANVGVAAAFFAGECGAGVVHSFEPVAPLFQMLSRNVRHFPACVAHEYGLSAAPGSATITYYPQADAMSGLYADPEDDQARARAYLLNTGISAEEADRRLEGRYGCVTMECELRTLSSVLQEEEIGSVDLLKVDVEGAELDVLRGIETLDWPRIGQVVAEVHDRHRARVERVLTERGFASTIEQDPRWEGTGWQMLYATRQ